MSSSPEVEVPSGVATLWRSMQRAYRAEPGLVVASLAMAILATVPDALFALWLKLLADGVIGHRRGLVLAAALGLAGSVAAGWVLRTAGGLTTPPLLSRQAVQIMGIDQDFSTRKARELLGWEPRTDYATGLEATIEWLEAEHFSRA